MAGKPWHLKQAVAPPEMAVTLVGAGGRRYNTGEGGLPAARSAFGRTEQRHTMASRASRPKSPRWAVAPPWDGAADLARRLRTAPLVAQVLHNRGLDEPEAARAFLNPKLGDLHPPELLGGAEAAAKRIARAVAGKEKIFLYGDYDVDGMTAVAILHAVLRLVGAEPEFYVPHRLEEGYGVNAEAVRSIIAGGAKLLITVDCGICAAGPLAEATAAGVDVIVTDHHIPPEVLPAAVAIVHPTAGGPGYPNPDLAGAGVAFKLAWQVARQICGEARVDEPMRKFLLEATCLAALGTIADVVPLLGENRVLATYGLRGLAATQHVGLRALIESASLGGEKLDAYHVGFVLAPRLNACGRMGHARLAVELLTGASPERSREIAAYLDRQNTERRRVEKAITDEAVEQVVSGGLADGDHRAIVLASESWHGGVIGIVASRLVSRFARPAILIAVGADACGQGSGRSIPGFHMRDALAACGEHLVSFGGHAMAGGLRIGPGRIDAFAAAFVAYANERIGDEQLAGALHVDAETTLAALSFQTVEHLARMAPFGQGNPHPLVAVGGCEVLTAPRRMGRSGNTVGMMLARDGATIRAVGFGMGDLADDLVGVRRVDVVGEPVLNRFRGRTNVELHLKDVRRK